MLEARNGTSSSLNRIITYMIIVGDLDGSHNGWTQMKILKKKIMAENYAGSKENNSLFFSETFPCDKISPIYSCFFKK